MTAVFLIGGNEGRACAFPNAGFKKFTGTSFEKDAVKVSEKILEFMDGVFYSEYPSTKQPHKT